MVSNGELGGQVRKELFILIVMSLSMSPLKQEIEHSATSRRHDPSSSGAARHIKQDIFKAYYKTSINKKAPAFPPGLLVMTSRSLSHQPAELRAM